MVGIFFCRGFPSPTSPGTSYLSPQVRDLGRAIRFKSSFHFITILRPFTVSFSSPKRLQAEKVARLQLPQATADTAYTLSPPTDTMTGLIISISFHSGLYASIPKPAPSKAYPQIKPNFVYDPCRKDI